jgi:hypothetical protein
MSVITVSSRPSAAVEPPRLLHLDQDAHNAIGVRELSVRHSLVDHPALTMEAIAQLADEMPAGTVERHSANQPLLVPGGAADLTGTPSDTVRAIDTNRTWMVLWNIEQIPRYHALLDAILDEARSYLPGREGVMGRREAFLFLSAPNAVTPVHFDPEHNFLLQIRGVKEMNIGRFVDRAAALRELDRYHDGGHRNLVEIPPLSSRNVMHPGQGVYVYPFAPHWVLNGPAPSVSLSITFRTEKSERDEAVHVLNARMRKRGMHPRPLGDSPAIDRAKAAFYGTASWIHRRGKPKLGARDYS